MKSMVLLKKTISNDEKKPEQLDLFYEYDTNKNIQTFNQINKTSNNVYELLNKNNTVFFETEIVQFYDLDIKKNTELIDISFTISLKDASKKDKDLTIEIKIDTGKKYNNINIKHSEMFSMKMRLEVLKYFVTTQGFHKLMSEILNLDSTPDNLKTFNYHHSKHGFLKDYTDKEKNKYKGEKLLLGKIGLSNNYFPNVFLLKDNCKINFNKNTFNFHIDIEIDNTIYTINGNGIKTRDNTGNFQEVITNIIFDNFNIVTLNNFGEDTIKYIKEYINYYICEL